MFDIFLCYIELIYFFFSYMYIFSILNFFFIKVKGILLYIVYFNGVLNNFFKFKVYIF